MAQHLHNHLKTDAATPVTTPPKAAQKRPHKTPPKTHEIGRICNKQENLGREESIKPQKMSKINQQKPGKTNQIEGLSA